MSYAIQKILKSTRVIGIRVQKHQGIGIRLFGNGCPASSIDNDTNSKTISLDEAKPFTEMPGPKPLPLIGNIHRFLPYIGEFYDKENQDFSIFIKKIFEGYGNVVRITGIPGRPDQVFVYDPIIVEKVYRDSGRWPSRDENKTLGRYRKVVRKDVYDGVHGLLSSDGEEWWKFRSVVNKVLMRPQVARLYIEAIDKVADDFIKRIRLIREENAEMPENFANELNRWALESIGVVAFDKRFGCLDENLAPDSEAQKLISSVLRWFELWYKLESEYSSVHWTETKNWKEYVATLDYFNEIASKYIDEAIVRIEKNPKANEEDKSVLERLIAFDKKIAYVMTLDMLQAGIDTTAQTVATNLYHLAKNPEKQKILREELKEHAPDGKITAENSGKIPYLRACTKETLRMAPVAYANQRIMTRDIVVGGYRVPKKTPIVLCHLAMTTNPEIYSNPTEYMPERWLRSSPHFSDAHKFAFMPFGHGARTCIGSRFAEMEVDALLTRIITNFQLSWHHEDMKYNTKIIRITRSPLRYKMTDIQTAK